MTAAGRTAAGMTAAGRTAAGMTAVGMTAAGMTAAAGVPCQEPLASSFLFRPDLEYLWIQPCSLGWRKYYQLLQIPRPGNELASWNQEHSPVTFLGVGVGVGVGGGGV